ncbi:MAG: hypothetical protein NWQ13_02060 [Glaciimonas sp.]|nr:hypothetical protein [Glaciimonas sp.]
MKNAALISTVRRLPSSTLLLFMLLNIMLFSGCSSIGPEGIRANRIDYNLAVQSTSDQELLLNIIRAHYRDNLYFTSVERIVAAQDLTRSASASFGAGFTKNWPDPVKSGSSQAFTLGAGAAFNDRPTIFYAPIEGEKFVRQMMTPMNPETLALLVYSGWSIDRVFMLALQEVNGLRNAPTASGPTPSYAPEYAAFREATQMLRQLQREHNLTLERSVDEQTVVLRLINGQANSAPALRLKQLLQLNPSLDRFTLASGSKQQNEHTIALTTRPLMATLNFLSQGVEVPATDISSGKIRTTVESDGVTPFDWQKMLNGVFKVKSSSTPPAAGSTSVAVPYRGVWFYIDDNDLDSKATFVLLTQLISLHSVPPKGGPTLSYSIGG